MNITVGKAKESTNKYKDSKFTKSLLAFSFY